MENESTPLDEGVSSAPESKPKIYSKMAIMGFSVFMSPIFGGVLLMQNLKYIGNKKAAYLILVVSVLLLLATIIIVGNSEKKTSSLTWLCNLIGGAILSEYFFKKYFSNGDEYEKKKIWKPLIISILIAIPLVLATIYSSNLEK
ncbi:MAG TPA: hypothetical protein PKN75_12040 [Bacteroidia bacterium]|nr:hypothetical protein [Bacteroidia bacterium]HNU34307.1 hypothetical protein [Bacteroidia bacterium]